MVFPVVMYGCENWTIRKAECQRIDAFELWCWRRLLRIPWTLTLIRTDLSLAQAEATALPSQPPRHPRVRREVRADSPRNLGGKVSESQGRRWLRRGQHPSRRAEAWEGRRGPPPAPERGRGLPGTHGSNETSLVPDLRCPLPQVSSEGTGRRASLSPLSECGPQRGGRKSPWGPSPRPPALPRGLPASLSSGHEQGEQGPWVTPVVPRWGVIHRGGGVALERKGLEGGGPRVHLALDKKPPPGCAPA